MAWVPLIYELFYSQMLESCSTIHMYFFMNAFHQIYSTIYLFIYFVWGGGGRVVLQHVEMDVLDIYVVLYDIGI